MNELLGGSTTGTERRGSWLIALAVAVVLVLSVTACQSAAREQGSNRDDNRVEGQYIVEVERANGAEKLLRDSLAEWQPEAVKRLETDRALYLIHLAEDPGVEIVQRHMEHRDGVVDVQPNYRYQSTGGEGDSSLEPAYD